MLEKHIDLPKELQAAVQWCDRPIHRQPYEEATGNQSREKLLHPDMARLRLKLRLGRGAIKE